MSVPKPGKKPAVKTNGDKKSKGNNSPKKPGNDPDQTPNREVEQIPVANPNKNQK